MAFHITALIMILTLSLLLSLRLLGHSLVIRSFRLRPSTLSLFALKYTYRPAKSHAAPPALSVSSPHLHIALHLPRPSNPTILTITLYNYDYADLEHCVALTKLKVVVSLFPVLTRVSAGPFLAVTLDDFRVRVFSSEHMPQWIQKLRGNLVYTVLNGDTFRLEDLETNIVLSTIGGRGITDDDTDEAHQTTDIPKSFQNGSGDASNTYNIAVNGASSGESQKQPPDDAGEEAIVTLNSSQWHITNFQHRHYTFGTISAQLRRSWDGDRGSFVLIAKESRWVQAPRPYKVSLSGGGLGKANVRWLDILWSVNLCWPLSEPKILLGTFRHILITPLLLPSFLVRILNDPGSSIDLYVPRADVTFDRFRLQDAELVRQGWGWVRREYTEHGGGDAMRDAIWKAVLVFLD